MKKLRFIPIKEWKDNIINQIVKALNEVIEYISGAGPGGFELIIVEQLPTKGEKGKFYLLRNEGTEHDNYYDEYIWLNDKWERMGTTKINLTEIYNRIDEVKQLAYAGL